MVPKVFEPLKFYYNTILIVSVITGSARKTRSCWSTGVQSKYTVFPVFTDPFQCVTNQWPIPGERERERIRGRGRERERDRERDRQTDTHIHKHTDRETERDRCSPGVFSDRNGMK